MPEEKKVDHGKTLLTWDFPEYVQHERSGSWYVTICIVLVAILVYAIFTANFLFALFIVLFGLILGLQTRRSPVKVEFKIFENGVTIGERFYEWDDIKNFCLVRRPPDVKRLYIDLKNVLTPDFSVPLENQNPDKVHKVLKNYLEENIERKQETLIDRLSRWLKI